MAGSRETGLKAAKTNKERYGEDFYTKLGSLGGRATGATKGMAAQTPEFRRAAGRLGGQTSKRRRNPLKGYEELMKELGEDLAA